MGGYHEQLAEIDFNGEALEQARLSGEVTTYFLSPEEMEKRYGKSEPRKPRKHVGWPECGQPNMRHIARKASLDIIDDDTEEVDPEEEIDLDEIERIESGATEPTWGDDGCKW